MVSMFDAIVKPFLLKSHSDSCVVSMLCFLRKVVVTK